MCWSRGESWFVPNLTYRRWVCLVTADESIHFLYWSPPLGVSDLIQLFILLLYKPNTSFFQRGRRFSCCFQLATICLKIRGNPYPISHWPGIPKGTYSFEWKPGHWKTACFFHVWGFLCHRNHSVWWGVPPGSRHKVLHNLVLLTCVALTSRCLFLLY